MWLQNSSSANTIEGNLIGTDKNSPESSLNSNYDVKIDGSDNTIGGDGAARNTIAFNAGDGVQIGANSSEAGVTGNSMLVNSIFSNGGLGIDLGTNGPTANDLGDADAGPNDLQNSPDVTSARASRRGTTIKGTLNSTPNTLFVVQVFSNPTGDAEGKTFIRETSVATDASGNASFSIRAKRVSGVITATATNFTTSNTSEFSAPRKVRRI